jgi:glutamine synthetase
MDERTTVRGSFFPHGRLEHELGTPRDAWTTSQLIDFVRERGIRIVGLMHVGGDGLMKTLDFAPRSESHLADVLEGGERADGSSLFPNSGIRAGASDIVLRPRLETAFLDPFDSDGSPSLLLLCDHVGRDGRPLEVSPATILRRAHERLVEATGAELWALGEVEYFLGLPAGDRAVYGGDDRGYHAAAPFVFGEDLRRRALALLLDMGVPVKYAHSEVGYIGPTPGDDFIWEQHEIELALTPLPRAADAIALTAWVLRNLARREGMRCSFDPIMRKGHAGSGMHVHLSLVREGEHLDVPADDEAMPDEAKWLIAGLVRIGGSLMAFGNTTEGSFVRLTQGKEAPNAVTWGRYNRHALVRLPIQAKTAEGRTVSVPTIEFRLPDGSAHAHLLLAGVAQALVHGREIEDVETVLRRTNATESVDSAVEPVPLDFPSVAQALRRFRPHLEAGGVFPAGLIDATIEMLEEAGAMGRTGP